MGRPFMPHQRLYVDVMLEVQSEEAGDAEPGEWAYDDGLLSGQRRLGKTSIVVPVTAHRARLVKVARIFMTAQNRDKARARWMDATDDVLASVLRDDVRRKIGNMHEELRWVHGGALFKPFAPNEDGLHSETPDLVWVDELWAFDDEQRRQVQAGYVPAFATTSGQAWKMSTAGTPRSAWLNTAVADGRAAVEGGTQLGTCHVEYGLPDRVDGTLLKHLTDSELIEACVRFHPAVCHAPGCPGPGGRRPCPHGFTVRPAAIRSAWTQFAGDSRRSDFLRAWGNRPSGDMTERWVALDEQRWRDQREPDGIGIPPLAKVSLGVWVDDDSNDVAVSAGWRDSGGAMHSEHLMVGDGVRWATEYLRGVCERQQPRAVAITNTGANRDLADELAPVLEKLRPKPQLQRVSQADLVAACTRHRTELAEGQWFHRPHQAATDAAAAAGWRKHKSSGGEWLRPGESISALGAQTLAGWAHDHAPARQPRKFKVR